MTAASPKHMGAGCTVQKRHAAAVVYSLDPLDGMESLLASHSTVPGGIWQKARRVCVHYRPRCGLPSPSDRLIC